MYGLIYGLTVILIFDYRIIPRRAFFLFWFIIMVFLSFSIRWGMIEEAIYTSNSQVWGDIGSYSYNMALESPFISYHLREPIFWVGSRLLYKVIGNFGLVFVVMDVVLFLTFYKSIELLQSFFPKHIKLHNAQYLYFAAFLVYPYIVGMHNYYRQILGVTIAICAMGLADKKLGKALFIFLISILVHNATILLFPIILLVKKYNIFYCLIVIAALTIIFNLFMSYAPNYIVPTYFISEVSRRFYETTLTVDVFNTRTLIYASLLFLLTFFVILSEYLAKSRENFILIKVLFFLNLVYLFSLLFFPNNLVASRIFFMVLTLIFILIGLYIENRFKPIQISRLLYFHLSLVPLLGLRGDGLYYYFGS